MLLSEGGNDYQIASTEIDCLDYENGMEKMVDVKAQFLSEYVGESDNVLDLGGMDGSLMRSLRKLNPDIKTHVVDYLKSVLEKGKKIEGDLNLENPMGFHQIDIFKENIPVENLEAVSAVGFVHEIVTAALENISLDKQGEKTFETLINLFSKVRGSLKDGGKFIMRDPVLPENPNEILSISFSDVDDAVKDLDGRGGETPKVLMKKFIQTYRYISESDRKIYLDQLSQNNLKMSADLIGEYRMMRTFNYKDELGNTTQWKKEAMEKKLVLSPERIEKVIEKGGFKVLRNERVHEKNYYADFKSEEGIVIVDSSGNNLSLDESNNRFSSHIYSVLEKKSMAEDVVNSTSKSIKKNIL